MKPLKRLQWLADRVLHGGGYGCSDTEHLLFAYVQDELAPAVRQKLDQHMADCPGCVRYVASYRQVIQLTRDHGLKQVAIPPEISRRLQDFIREHPQLH